MRLVLLTITAAILVGHLTGGRLARLSSIHIRLPSLALAGILLQLAPVAGIAGFVLLLVSFVLLLAFTLRNLRLAGFPLILVGLTLNLAVIAANEGMPVTRHALVASGQQDTLPALVSGARSKHHLASGDDLLLPLADIIPIGTPVNRAVSAGDILTHAGAAWFLIAMMRRPAGARRALPSDHEMEAPSPLET